MPRSILASTRVHPAVRAKIEQLHADVVAEVEQAVSHHAVVVVGMFANPFVMRASAELRRAGIAHHYIGYGGYFSQWRRRNALKMWTGWPTFPIVFVRGVLIGGAQDLTALLRCGELRTLLEDVP
ncbi:MAG: glutaredoxin [Aquimonas sp.]|nr:glutaredoxin [Aquimonas sp.]